MRIRSIATGLVPPILEPAARRALRAIRRQKPDWEYAPGGWEHPTHGWEDASEVIERYRRKLPEYRAAIAAPHPIGVPTSPARDVNPTVVAQNIILEFAYALTLASRSRQRVAVLDWGGGIGFLSFVAEELLPHIDVAFAVKELEAICAVGRELVPTVEFWDDESCLDRHHDLIIASNSLQYVEDWPTLLRRFAQAAAGGYVLLQHLPTTPDHPSFVLRQNAYGTAFTNWVFGRGDVLSAASAAGLTLVRDFQEGTTMSLRGTPGDWELRGFLFRAEE